MKKKEDRSADSRVNHIKYYRSLNEMAVSIQREMDTETDGAIMNHLRNRIDAITKDKKRIEQMFPEINWDEVN